MRAMPCPACGFALPPSGTCNNPNCEMTDLPATQQWQSQPSDTNVTKTYPEWCAELGTPANDSLFREDDGNLDNVRGWTRDDFIRRAGL